MTRFLQGLAGIQAVVLIVLAAIWWQRADALPAPSAPSGTATEPAARAIGTAAQADVTASPAGGEPVRDDAAAGGGSVVLHGRLLGLAPRTSAAIELFATAGGGGAAVRATVKGDEYAIAGLTPGAWRVSCRVHRHHDLDVDCTLTSAPLQRRDLTLVPILVLPVVLTARDGRWLRAALNEFRVPPALSVVASVEPIPDELPPIENAYYSRYGAGRHRQHGELDPSEFGPNDGMLELMQPPPVHAALLLRNLVIARTRVLPGDREVRLVVDPADIVPQLASLRVRAVGATGQPLDKARLEVGVLPGQSAIGQPLAGGAIGLDRLPPGFATVRIVAPASEELLLGVVLGRGEQRDLGDVVLQPAVSLQVELVADDAAATRLSGTVQWAALDTWRAPEPLAWHRGPGSQSAGERRYLVQGVTDDGRFGSAIATPHAGAERCQLVLRRATPVRFRCSGDDARGCTLVVRTPANDPVHVVAFGGGLQTQQRPLVPGAYRLEVFDGFGVARSVRSLAIGAEPLDVEVP